MDIDARRKRHKINRANARNKARQFIASYFATHPCADCGECDPIVLTFDHVHGEKINDIANMVQAGLGLETIKAEIEKCEVRCFNCHAIRTHQQLKSNRWQRINKGG
jgi:hypothetical protein